MMKDVYKDSALNNKIQIIIVQISAVGAPIIYV